ncbi:glucitol operon activator protein [Klebsiella pneumoniae]|uniref:Glucitol operon activator protein n=1 Tax=Klebsiella pneumoniae TaxID=573 RepID=A0A2X3D454_KLEPN|nr:glucitol operon activator protein [Klebsiella pneumoniae]
MVYCINHRRRTSPGLPSWPLAAGRIRRFNRAFDSLCQQGRVGVGRSAGRFQPRAIVAIAVDDNDRISDTLLMKGFTIFASPAKDPGSGRQTYCGIAA